MLKKLGSTTPSWVQLFEPMYYGTEIHCTGKFLVTFIEAEETIESPL